MRARRSGDLARTIPGIEQCRSHLKCMLVSAASISDETALKADEIFGDAMYQGHGQTEVLPIAMIGPRHWFAKDGPGSRLLRACSTPLPFAQLQIWDGDNKPVRPGEIVAKCEGQMLDGADDMVISGSFNIYLAELENVIAAHPDIIEVAAFGIPDERWGD